MTDAYDPVKSCYAPGYKALIKLILIGNVQTMYGYCDFSACQMLYKNPQWSKKAVAKVYGLNGIFAYLIERPEKGIGQKPDEMFYRL